MAEDIGLFEAMYSQRAIRHIKPDPIPDELIEKIIDAGIHAPNGGNQQGWGFVVIKDKEVMRKMAPLYNGVGRPNHGQAATWSERNSATSAEYLSEHVADVPVWILAVTKNAGDDIHTGASVYPAVQNMLLAARALGLASVLTTRVRRGYEAEMREWIGLPPEFVTAAMIPLGWPIDGYTYGPTTRKPGATVTHWDKWGNQKNG
jgi:nitroreductase